MTATLTKMGGGSTTRDFETENPDEVAAARAEFAALIDAGFKAYDGSGEQVDSLQLEGETLLHSRLAGG